MAACDYVKEAAKIQEREYSSWSLFQALSCKPLSYGLQSDLHLYLWDLSIESHPWPYMPGVTSAKTKTDFHIIRLNVHVPNVGTNIAWLVTTAYILVYRMRF